MEGRVLLAAGMLDASFGDAGRATVAFDLGGGDGDYASDMAIQADGKIVVAGTATGLPETPTSPWRG